MKYKIPFVLLLVMGFVEVVYGMFMGPLLIYAQEAPFAIAMKRNQWDEQQFKAYGSYIANFKHQWHVVVWFGLITIALTLVCWKIVASRDRAAQPAAGALRHRNGEAHR